MEGYEGGKCFESSVALLQGKMCMAPGDINAFKGPGHFLLPEVPFYI